MGTFVVAMLVFGSLALICRRMWRRHKIAKENGGVGCGCGCDGCNACLAKQKPETK